MRSSLQARRRRFDSVLNKLDEEEMKEKKRDETLRKEEVTPLKMECIELEKKLAEKKLDLTGLLSSQLTLLNRFLQRAQEEKEQKSWFDGRIIKNNDEFSKFVMLGMGTVSIVWGSVLLCLLFEAMAMAGFIIIACLSGSFVFVGMLFLLGSLYMLDDRGVERFDEYKLSFFSEHIQSIVREIQSEFKVSEDENNFVHIDIGPEVALGTACTRARVVRDSIQHQLTLFKKPEEAASCPEAKEELEGELEQTRPQLYSRGPD